MFGGDPNSKNISKPHSDNSGIHVIAMDQKTGLLVFWPQYINQGVSILNILL